MTSSGPDDPTVSSPPPPELAGLDPKDLLQAGLETVPPVTLPPQPVDTDATLPVARPQSTQPAAQVELPLPAELTALLPGGNYHVESFLGQGGMGAVYRGTQVRLKRPVAIKIMRRDQGQDFGFEQRFEREAQAMAKLNHPNIVSVIDYGEAGPAYLYIVMELVDGADLMDVIRGGQMTQEMALSLLPQICDALQFAHDHGIVHRDIKPSNIMVTRDGRVKMADFGLAKPMDGIETGFRTQTGTGMGTPDYAAPEQFDPNGHIDHRADIYALGVMIYQMITGQLPRGAWKRPSERAAVAPQWDEIVSRAMQSDPSDRYQQASEVKTDVSSIPLHQGRAADPSAAATGPQVALGGPSALPRSQSRAPLLFGIIIGAAVLAIGAFFVLKKPEESRRGRQTAEEASSTSDTTTPPRALASAPTAAKQTLDLIALVDVQRDRLKAEGNAGANVWTKSGGQLVFTSGDKRAGKIAAPVALNGLRDYEIEIGVSTAAPDAIGIDLPMSATNQATIAFVPGEVVLLRDGNSSNVFGNWPKEASSPPWKLATRIQFDADGIHGTISATVNGTAMGEWHGALTQLRKTTEPHPDFPGQLVPALYIPSGDRTHTSWTLRTFGAEAKVLRGAAAAPAPINLLASVDVKRDAVKGQWELNPEGLVAKKGKEQLLSLHRTPPEEYDFEIEFTFSSGKEVGQVLPLPGGSIVSKMGFGKVEAPTQFFGFGPFFNRQNLNDPARKEGVSQQPRFKLNQRYRSLVQVRKNSLRALLDGVEVAQWSGDLTRFTGDPGFALPDPTHLGLGSFESDIVFHKIELRPVSASGTKPAVPTAPDFLTASSSTKFPPGQWVKVLNQASDVTKANNQGSGVTWQNGWLVPVTNKDNVEALFDSCLNGSVRTRVRHVPGKSDGATVKLRGGSSNEAYELRVRQGKELALLHVKFFPEKNWTVTATPLSTLTLPTPLGEGEEYTLQISMIGDRLQGRFNDIVIGPVTETRLPKPGNMGIFSSGVPVSGIEVINLDGLPESEALKAAAGGDASGSPSPPISKSSVATATKDTPFINTLGMKFVPVPITGGPTKGQRVLFSIWHTRVQDYAEFAKAQEAAGKKVDGSWLTQQKDGVPVGREPDHPVVGVTWDDAQAFCQWLTAKEKAEGKLPKDMKYRLPSDEEWS